MVAVERRRRQHREIAREMARSRSFTGSPNRRILEIDGKTLSAAEFAPALAEPVRSQRVTRGASLRLR